MTAYECAHHICHQLLCVQQLAVGMALCCQQQSAVQHLTSSIKSARATSSPARFHCAMNMSPEVLQECKHSTRSLRGPSITEAWLQLLWTQSSVASVVNRQARSGPIKKQLMITYDKVEGNLHDVEHNLRVGVQSVSNSSDVATDVSSTTNQLSVDQPTTVTIKLLSTSGTSEQSPGTMRLHSCIPVIHSWMDQVCCSCCIVSA